MSSVRSRRVAVAAGIVVAAFCVAGLVGAFWSAGSGPGGNGHALAGRLPTSAVPSASVTSRAATVTWAQSTVDGSLLGQLAGGGTPSRAMRRARSRLRSFPALHAAERSTGRQTP